MKFKNFLNIIYQEFIYGGHYIALGVPAIIFTTIILLNQFFSWVLIIIGYLLTFISYRYNYYKELTRDLLTNPGRTRYIIKSLNFSQILSIIYFFILLIILIFFTDAIIILFSLFFLIIGILYTNLFKAVTKKILAFKNLYIGISWALIIYLVAFYYSIFNWAIFFIFLFVFFRLFLNTVFFDIKDIKTDIKDNIKTIPVVFGKEKSLKFLHILNLLSFVPIVIGVYLGFLAKIALILLVFYLYSCYYLEKAKNKKSDIQKLSYIITDGEYFLWPIILLFGKAILINF